MPETCGLCCDTGLVVRDMTFLRCICSTGQSAIADQWHGRMIHPLDMEPSRDFPQTMAESPLVHAGGNGLKP